MKILKKYAFQIECEDQLFRVQTILDQFNVGYDVDVDESGVGFIETTFDSCPDECIDMLIHCI